MLSTAFLAPDILLSPCDADFGLPLKLAGRSGFRDSEKGFRRGVRETGLSARVSLTYGFLRGGRGGGEEIESDPHSILLLDISSI